MDEVVIEKLFEIVQFMVVIYIVVIMNVDYCELYFEEVWFVNIIVFVLFFEVLKKCGIYF